LTQNDDLVLEVIKLVQSELRKASIAITRDIPEGGMDALLQAMVCSEIGWRNPSRRLLVFATDARSHLAGDGRVSTHLFISLNYEI